MISITPLIFVCLFVCPSVRPSVRPSVCPLFFSLVSLKSVAHLECYKASKSVKDIHWDSISVSRVFQQCFKCIGRVYQRCIRAFQGTFLCVSRKFLVCFKEVSCVSHGSFMDVSMKFKGCFKEISMVFH